MSELTSIVGIALLGVAAILIRVYRREDVTRREIAERGASIYRKLEKYVKSQYVLGIKILANIGACLFALGFLLKAFE